MGVLLTWPSPSWPGMLVHWFELLATWKHYERLAYTTLVLRGIPTYNEQGAYDKIACELREGDARSTSLWFPEVYPWLCSIFCLEQPSDLMSFHCSSGDLWCRVADEFSFLFKFLCLLFWHFYLSIPSLWNKLQTEMEKGITYRWTLTHS